jgi:hypothetical protein
MSTARDRLVVNQVIVLIHGIRDLGGWLQTVDRVLGSKEVKVIMPKYGWFPPLRFIAPWDTSIRPMKRVHREIENIKREYPNARISVIAHSFGCHLLTRLLQEYPHDRVFRIILCGSVVKQSFQWEQVRDRFGENDEKTGFIVNDCGNRDPWPLVGAFAGWRYGTSGTDGSGSTYVEDRYHKGGHGLFFNREFIEHYWKPFITRGDVVPGSANQGEGIPWYVRLLQKLSFNLQGGLLCLALVLLVVLGLRWWLAGPERSRVDFSNFTSELRGARSEGEVATTKLADRYRDHKITWSGYICDRAPLERALWISADPSAEKDDQVFAKFATGAEYNDFAEVGSQIKIEGVVRILSDGPMLYNCRELPNGSD